MVLWASPLLNAQTTNVWTGSTSAVLTNSANYQAGSSVLADGNPLANFVFGRVNSTNRTFTIGSEFKVNRLTFENPPNGLGTFSFSGGFINFTGSSNGIFQDGSSAITISSAIKISDGPMTLGGNGSGLVTLSGSTGNDYAGKGVTKSGTSAFLITQSVTNTGTVLISGGTLAFSGTGNLASAYQLRGGVVAASGTFGRALGTTATSINFAAGSNGGFAAYGGALTVSTNLGTWGTTANSLTASSNLILGSSIADNVVTLNQSLNLGAAVRTIQLVDNAISANDAAAISGVISGTGGGLSLTGAGFLTMSGGNSYTGATTVGSAVHLTISNATGLGTIAAGTTVSSGGSLRLQGGITVGAEALNLSGTGVGAGNAGALRNISGNNSYGGDITLAADSRVNSDADTLTLGGAVGGAGRNFTVGGSGNVTMNGVIGTTTGTLTKDGAGTLTLGAANTFTGLTTVSGGSLVLSGSGSLAGAADLTASGAGLSISALGGSATSLTALSGVSGSTMTLGTKALTVGSANSSTTFAGVISGTGGSFIKTGTGTLTLSGTNTFTGGVSIQKGAVSITAGAGLGAGSTANLGVANTSSGRLIYTGTAGTLAQNINALGNGTDTIENAGSGLLTLSGTLTKNGTVLTLSGGNGGITVSGVIAGSSANSDLIVDSGTVTLTGANTYNGGTTVSAGTLIVNGNQSAATGDVTVDVGATLGGEGTIGGKAFINGNLRTGSSTAVNTVGTLTFADDIAARQDVTFGAGSTWLIDLVQGMNAASDSINAGNLEITSGAMLSFATTNAFTQKEGYTIASYSGNLSGVFYFGDADPWLNKTKRKIGEGQYSIDYGSGMNSTITLTAVPEPGTFGLLGLSLAGFFFRRLRKRRPDAAAAGE